MWRAALDTPAFLSNPFSFTMQRSDNVTRDYFMARLALWTVTFATSYDVVFEILSSWETRRGEGALLSFPGMSILGSPQVSIATSDGVTAAQLRQDVVRKVTDIWSYVALERKFGSRVDVLLECFSRAICSDNNANNDPIRIPVYETMKGLSIDFAASIFLNAVPVQVLNEQPTAGHLTPISQELETLTRSVWHAMTSGGLLMKWLSSTFKQGEQAKKRLFELFEQAPKDGMAAHLDPHHILLFTSSLQHKSFASVLTSFFLLEGSASPEFRAKLRHDVAHNGTESIWLWATMNEVLRLYPPLFGVFLAVQSSSVGSSPLKEILHPDDRVLCCIVSANRDPTKYWDPHHFHPERWICEHGLKFEECEVDHGADNKTPPMPLTFSVGPRACLGQSMIMFQIIKTCSFMLKRFDWSLCDGTYSEVKYRWIPVARPENDFRVEFRRVMNSG